MLSKKEKKQSNRIMALLRRQNKQNKVLLLLTNIILSEHDFNLALSKSNLELISPMLEKEYSKEWYFKWMQHQEYANSEQKKYYKMILKQLSNDENIPIIQLINDCIK